MMGNMTRRSFTKGAVAVGVAAVFGGASAALADEDAGAGTEGAGAGPSSTEYPLTVENNGVEWTFERAPERVVVLDYTIAEEFAALGLEDRVVALAPSDYLIEDVLEEYRNTVAAMPTFEEDELQLGVVPNFESVLSKEPDLVLGSAYSFYDVNAGSKEGYIDNGINVYATEGTYVDNPTVESVYNDILNLGKIFDVQERAQEVVDEMKARIDEATSPLDGVEAVSVFVYDFASATGLSTIGGATFEDWLIGASGGENVFGDLGEQYPEVSVEDVATMEAEWIVVNAYVESVGDDADAKIETMQTDELFSEVPAVVNGNFITLRAIEYQPCLHAPQTIELLARTLHPETGAGA